ncbi:alpha-N-acetylneuraminide alpha-2,8-sialyltransferase-like [Dendrobates tinctorius]|uniref:alpha-N-acetylneuraminide alpha-2,8-sialyltransferase-like n=1 Tax=Dendrobates tinctorius TaxID=92724 RepID=UPI003CCA6CD8
MTRYDKDRIPLPQPLEKISMLPLTEYHPELRYPGFVHVTLKGSDRFTLIKDLELILQKHFSPKVDPSMSAIELQALHDLESFAAENLSSETSSVPVHLDWRLNLPPLNWTQDVGTKTDIVSANPSILIDKYSSLREQRKPFINMVKAYGSALILLPAFSFAMNTEVSLRTLYSFEDFGMKNRVVFFNPQYLRSLTSYWKGIGLKFQRMSSGLLMASAAFEICEKVTLYGFWPFSEDLEGTVILHHYYDNKLPKPGVHSMPEEFYQYLLMHSQGALKLQLGQC